MLTTIKELNDPRYMNMAGIFGAKDIKVWNAKDIEVDLTTVGLEASPTNVFRSFTKEVKGAGTILNDLTPEQAVEAIVAKLEEKFII